MTEKRPRRHDRAKVDAKESVENCPRIHANGRECERSVEWGAAKGVVIALSLFRNMDPFGGEREISRSSRFSAS